MRPWLLCLFMQLVASFSSLQPSVVQSGPMLLQTLHTNACLQSSKEAAQHCSNGHHFAVSMTPRKHQVAVYCAEESASLLGTPFGFGLGARIRFWRRIEDIARRSFDTSDAMRWSLRTLCVLDMAACVSNTTTLCTCTEYISVLVATWAVDLTQQSLSHSLQQLHADACSEKDSQGQQADEPCMADRRQNMSHATVHGAVQASSCISGRGAGDPHCGQGRSGGRGRGRRAPCVPGAAATAQAAR